ncbi:MAG: cadmium-translocating P-type ATPase [Anaerolineaceae bacterium]|nr:MAG: cadmium-translocating P-type ATPase [Anaerolineaceae bacterium]
MTPDLKIGASSKWLTQEWLEPRLVVVTALAILGGFIAGQTGAPEAVRGAFGLLAYIAGGFYGVQTAFASLVEERKIDVDLLMILAALGAAFIGSWPEGAILLFLFSLSNVLQDYAIGRSRNAIRGLLDLYPDTARVRRGAETLTVSFDEIAVGDVVMIEPGERIPVDGEVIDGVSTVDESPITGESLPVEKTTGDDVFAGTLNNHGALDVRATRSAHDNTLARIIQLVEDAQENQAPTERFLERFEQYYAGFILLSIALIIVIPPTLFNADFDSNFYRAMVLMTVASPCALIISVPASFISAIASSARMGVLFKGGAYLEQMAALNAVAFDKTGTLTRGKPAVTGVIPYDTVTEAELMTVTAAVEARSEHPLAKAIVAHAKKQGITPPAVTDFNAEVGRGVVAMLDGERVHAGTLKHLAATYPAPDDLQAEAERLQDAGNTVIGVVIGGRWLGLIALADQVRPEAAGVVAQLQALGVEVAMFTGDNPRVAQAIAEQTGIKRVHAGLLPQDKVAALQALQREVGVVAMIGDGVNDAPALATAHVGVAMGAAGADVALETADVVLMGDKLALIPQAIALSQKARRVVWQNIVFSLSVIVVLVMGALFINLPLPLGVLAHEGSTVIVVLNGLLALLVWPEIKRRREAAVQPAP